MPEVKDWLTVEEAASWLAVPVEAVWDAARAGQLPTLTIGGFVRISREALLDMARDGGVDHLAGKLLPATLPEPADGRTDSMASAAAGHPPTTGAVPLPQGLTWLKEMEPGVAFDYHWPSGENAHYEPAWEGKISLYGKPIAVRVGQYQGEQRGEDSRLAVLFDGSPICEYRATADGDGWASLIKPDGRATVRAGDPLPSLYLRSRVDPYNEAIGKSGQGIARAPAVMLQRDDITSIVHHAAARWLGKNRYPIEPQRP